MNKDEWIERAIKQYIAGGVEPEFALECADAAYGAWVDSGSDPDTTPEEEVDADLECWGDG